MDSITFSSPVDPVFGIWSVGSVNTPAAFDFLSKSPENFTLKAGGPSHEFDGTSITVNGQTVNGLEGNGVIQFEGTCSSITFNPPDFENSSRLPSATTRPSHRPPGVPAPATLSHFGLGLAAFPANRCCAAAVPNPTLNSQCPIFAALFGRRWAFPRYKTEAIK
jgi:hypothetical protein